MKRVWMWKGKKFLSKSFIVFFIKIVRKDCINHILLDYQIPQKLQNFL